MLSSSHGASLMALASLVTLFSIVLISSTSVAPEPALVHLYDDIRPLDFCSYYELQDFSELSELNSGTLTLDSKKEVTGRILGGSWEWQHTEYYNEEVVDIIVPYSVTVCIENNVTKSEECHDQTLYNTTYKEVQRERLVWKSYDNYKSLYDITPSLKNSDVQNVRFCAGIELERTSEGFAISADIIPQFDGETYTQYNWINKTWTRWPIYRPNNLSNPFLVNDTFGVNIGGGVQYVWCENDSAYIYNDTDGNIYCANSTNVTGTFIDEGNGTSFGNLDDSLRLWLRMNDTSAIDSSNYHYSMTSSGVTQMTGKIGHGLHFDGSNDYVRTNAVNLFNDEYTATFWVKPGTYTHYNIIEKADSLAPETREWYMNVETGTSNATNQDYQFVVSNGATYMCIVNGPGAPLEYYQWNHVALLVNDSGCYVFINGKIEDSDTSLAGTPNVGSDYFRVASRSDDKYYNGTFDDVRLYNRSLSEAEIATIYNNTHPDNYSSVGDMETYQSVPQITIYSPKNITYPSLNVNMHWAKEEDDLTSAFHSVDGGGNQSLFFYEGNYTNYYINPNQMMLEAKDYILNPTGISYDSDYFWLVASGTENKVSRLWRKNWSYSFFQFSVKNETTDSLGITSDGDFLWVTDTGEKSILKYWKNNGTYTGYYIDTSGQDCRPTGLTSNGSHIWASCLENKKVVKYLLNGTYVDQFNLTELPDEPPYYLTQNGTYFWITADVANNTIYKYSMDGAYTGVSYAMTAENSDPYGIQVEGDSLWLVDREDRRIYRYAPVHNGFYNVTMNFSTQGQHNVTLCLNNTDGNLNCSTVHFSIDSIPPTISIDFPQNGTRYNLTWINITGTASDDHGVSVWINDTNFGTNLGNYTDWNFTNTSIAEGEYSLKITANDTAGNEVSAEVHFSVGVWDIKFHIYSGEDGSNLTSVSVYCNNSWSGTIDSGDTVGFTTGDYECEFEESTYFDKTVVFKADPDKTVDVKMSRSGFLSLEEHDLLQAVYDCLYSGDCLALNLLLNINESTTKTWNQFKPTDWSTVGETVISDVVNSTSNITINYSISVPVKEGYGLIEGIQGYDDFLPIRLSYWFLDMETQSECYDQGDYDVAPVEPYCKPVVAYTVGQIGTQANFTVEIQPNLPAGQYYIVRSIEIDPDSVWIDYGQEILGMVTVTEGNSHASASVRGSGYAGLEGLLADEGKAGASEQTDTVPSGEGDGLNGLLAGNAFDPSYVSVIVSMATLIVVLFVYMDSRRKRSPWGY